MDIEKEAISLVRDEKTEWEDATAFITEKIAFQMRNLIRQLRKNYYGIFDEPIDPTTGRKKVWIPLTESIVENTVKNIDLDTKDINFRAKRPRSIGLTSVVRSIVKNYLDNTFFGEKLDEALRMMAIDGTVVWKTTEKTVDGEKIADTRIVDLLNFYIDPTAHSIQETEAVIERSVMSIKEFQSMDGWINKDLVEGDTAISKNDDNQNSDVRETKMVEVFERWGLMPKRIITGKEDDDELIDGRIVCSDNGGTWIYHLAETIKKKPYEEAWYSRVPGRWYGRGSAEKLIMLQLWLNVIVNIRINRSYFAQLGIFKIKNNSGVTPQMISRLAANGAIMVNNMEDIEQLAMKEASQSSYNDEQVIQGWAAQVTSAHESATGEALPASTPATNAVLQSRSAQSAFVLIKEGFGMFLQRWLKRHAIPIIMKNVSRGDIVRVTGEARSLEEMDKRMADAIVYKAIKKSKGIFDPFDIEKERQRVLAKLRGMGKDRYVRVMKDIDVTEYDVQVYITNEEIDKAVLTQNLVQMLSLVPEGRVEIAKQVLDIMGLDGGLLPEQTAQPQGNQAPRTGVGTEQQVTTEANTPNL